MYVVVGRQTFIESRSSTVVCAPVYSAVLGLSTEVVVGIAEGLKHSSAIQCDRLTSIEKSRLTGFVGQLGPGKLAELRGALLAALALE